MQGHILSARYEILEPLSSGGFSKTYVAKDLQSGCRCVVKQLTMRSNEPNFVKEAKRLFEKEAQILFKLNDYPQIPQVIDYFEEENQLYLVQEFIEGQTLNSQLYPEQPWPEEQVIALVKDCLGILASIHAQGVIHRDLKPDNLMIRQKDGRLVLIDFGSVKEFNPQHSQIITPTIMVGTRGYMPPEQIQGRPRKSSDLYALGMVAIQALTGRQPTDFTEKELIWQPYCTVSPFFAAIINKMVEEDLKQRFSSATAILSDLEQKTAPIPPQPVSSMESGLTVLGTSLTQLPNSSVEAQSQITSSSEPIPSFFLSLRHSLGNLRKYATVQTLTFALLIGLLAGLGVYYIRVQQYREKQAKIEATMGQLESAYYQKRYEECLTKVQEPETLRLGIPEAQRLNMVGKCGLASANTIAQSSQYGKAMQKLDQVSQIIQYPLKSDPLVEEEVKNINAKINDRGQNYARELLKQAAVTYTQEGNLNEARSLISEIPPHYSKIHGEAQELSKEWAADYNYYSLIVQDAEQALEEEKWQEAIDHANRISRDNLTPYWISQAQKIRDQGKKGIEKGRKGQEKERVSSRNTQFSSQNRSNRSEPTSTNDGSWIPVPADLR